MWSTVDECDVFYDVTRYDVIGDHVVYENIVDEDELDATVDYDSDYEQLVLSSPVRIITCMKLYHSYRIFRF